MAQLTRNQKRELDILSDELGAGRVRDVCAAVLFWRGGTLPLGMLPVIRGSLDIITCWLFCPQSGSRL